MRLLHDRFGTERTTLQVDHEGGELLSIEASEQLRHGPDAPAA